MNCVDKNICIFCLPKVHNTDLDIIDNDTKYIMQVLDLSLDLDFCEEPKICNDCTVDLQQSFEFKAMCLKTEKSLSPFLSPEENFNLNLNIVYLKENQDAESVESVSEPHKICRFCLQIIDDSNYIYVKESKDNLFISDVLHRHFSEVNLNISQDPIACLSCRDSLRRISIFISNCSRIEQGINEYVRTKGLNNRGFVDLNNVLDHFLKSELINIVKIELQYEGKQENGTAFAEVKTENIVHPDNLEVNIKKEDTGADPELTTNERNTFIQQPISERPYKCSVCAYGTKYEKDFQKHSFSHKTDQKITPHKCENGNFSTKYRISFRLHTMHVCPLCSFTTKNEKDLRTHMIFHQKSTDTQTYTCKICSFITNTYSARMQHRLTHKPTYKCQICNFTSKYRRRVRFHMDIHKDASKTTKDASKTTIYKCHICAFKTNQKSYLKMHITLHQRRSETYMCEVCAYRTTYKPTFTKHMLRHKEEPQTTMYNLYKCLSCDYEANYKSDLNFHALTHKEPLKATYTEDVAGEVQRYMDLQKKSIYKCKACSYKTKTRDHFRKHILKHKDLMEVRVYRCPTCSYESQYKRNVERHLVVHKDPSEVIRHRCEQCVYETEYKGTLKRHMLAHILFAKGNTNLNQGAS